MKFSNRKKDFHNEKSSYILKKGSSLYLETMKMFINIAREIGMPELRALEDLFNFVKGKSNKNSLIPMMLFGSPVEANKYVQGINNKTKHKIEKMIEDFSILETNKNLKA